MECAKNYIDMAIQELNEANIVIINYKYWISAMNAATNLYLSDENLKISIDEMKQNKERKLK